MTQFRYDGRTGGIYCHDAALKVSAMLATKAVRSSVVSVATGPLIPIFGRPQPRVQQGECSRDDRRLALTLLHDVRQLRDGAGVCSRASSRTSESAAGLPPGLPDVPGRNCRAGITRCSRAKSPAW